MSLAARLFRTTFDVRLNRRLRLILLALMLCSLPTSLKASSIGIEPQPAQVKARITIASGVRVRTSPQVSAEELARLPIGTIVQELERSLRKEQIGQSEDHWYRVRAPGEKEGWVFGALTAPFDPARREEIYRRLAAERLKVAETGFAEQTDLVNFSTRVMAEVKRPEVAAELELARLLSLQRSLALIPADEQQQPPYQSWIKAQDKQIIYSEPAGEWLVDPQLFWGLQQKHRTLPIAERIAWEGARIGLPGECEGFLACYFSAFNLTIGRYLTLYPQGAHAEEALSSLADLLKAALGDSRAKPVYQVPPEDRADLQKEIATLRAMVMKTVSAKKTAILDQINQVARRYR